MTDPVSKECKEGGGRKSIRLEKERKEEGRRKERTKGNANWEPTGQQRIVLYGSRVLHDNGDRG